jgi:Rrf2 family protein
VQLLNKNTDYAVRAIIYMAKNKGKLVSSSEIAKEERIPLPFIRRLLQLLAREKLIRTREGVKGGVFLKRSPAGIRLSEVIRICQGEVTVLKCLFRKEICPSRPRCVLRKKMKRIEVMINREFRKLTIDDLMG